MSLKYILDTIYDYSTKLMTTNYRYCRHRTLLSHLEPVTWTAIVRFLGPSASICMPQKNTAHSDISLNG